ncbi:hypothetical protein ACWEQL_00500 [Kitasatospora sp. NPDC004240]
MANYEVFRMGKYAIFHTCPFPGNGRSTSPVMGRVGSSSRHRPQIRDFCFPGIAERVVGIFAGLNSCRSVVLGHHPPAQKRRRRSFQVIGRCLRRNHPITRTQVDGDI